MPWCHCLDDRRHLLDDEFMLLNKAGNARENDFSLECLDRVFYRLRKKEKRKKVSVLSYHSIEAFVVATAYNAYR